MTVKELLVKARELISEPQHWCVGDYAHNKSGDPVDPCGKDAYSFCAVGAMMRAANGDWETEKQAFGFFHLAIGKQGAITDFNDRSNHYEILNAFDLAILLAA